MKPSRPLRALLLSLACTAALAAQAQTAPRIDIPAGDLAAALDVYARQSGTQLVYRADQLKGARTPGVKGQAASPQALDALLKGSGYRAQRDASGAVVIVPQAAAKPAAAAPPRRAPRRPRRHRPWPMTPRSPICRPCKSPDRGSRALRWKGLRRSP
ncbi:STN domain-containing protein [Thermomonas carbonis]|uniref:Secretin and TonB N-terminal domain-containing protein n=1 Tax=Thermomonas carbonis TaxID=1463158 RepID=A0A7G9SSG7_9GAMM|nr:STN domain-containing protein [Thermomonas carbonis]QNN70792.1 secretin and TonB N-terminal domain-containing protein [Thermomonas carbonis]